MKILIIRFSSIGDILLTTPVVRWAKTQLHATIHYLTKSKYRELLDGNPHVDCIHHLENIHFSKLQKFNFDFVIDLHKNLRSWRFRKMGRQYITFEKKNLNKWLLVRTKKDRFKVESIVDRYAQALQCIGIVADEKGLDFVPSVIRDDLLPLSKHSSYIVIVLGANYYTKRIPSELALKIIDHHHEDVVLIGGKDVQELGRQIKEYSPSRIYNLCGQKTISESAQVILSSTLVYTGDTGMMHLTAALQKKMVVVWGSTTPDFGMGPYYGPANKDRSSHWEVEKLSCRPCSKLGHDHCPKDHFRCMLDHQVV